MLITTLASMAHLDGRYLVGRMRGFACKLRIQACKVSCGNWTISHWTGKDKIMV